MWKEGKLEEGKGAILVHTVQCFLSVNFGLCGRNQHKRLRRPDGFRCLQFTEDSQGKTHQGGVVAEIKFNVLPMCTPIMKIKIDAPETV